MVHLGRSTHHARSGRGDWSTRIPVVSRYTKLPLSVPLICPEAPRIRRPAIIGGEREGEREGGRESARERESERDRASERKCRRENERAQQHPGEGRWQSFARQPIPPFRSEEGTTLHLTPYTLHPTPCTQQPTPETLHPTPYALHPRLDHIPLLGRRPYCFITFITSIASHPPPLQSP